jgi:phosphatidylserine/phosphatidylglycerophosphate/cardiolipin synthase-like enzyme
MRVTKREGTLSVRAVAGTHVVLMALDCAESKLAGFMGFAFRRQIGDVPGQDWLKGLKVFKSLDPAPKRGAEYSTFDNPIQSFLWSDYTAQPDTQYIYTVTAMYGRPGALTSGDAITFTVKTEKPDDGKHGIWFNRGAIAGQSFAREFENARLTDAIANNPKDRMTAWLSRGLLEACLDYIGNARPREALRVCAYEFTYAPILAALKAALADGVDVQIIYHKTPENESAIEAAGIPAQQGGKQILFGRWKTRIPHNKFILRLDAKGEPQSVWTGSTNFTASGFLGQTNVGHLVGDTAVARAYLTLWQGLSGDPGPASARDKAMALSPNPPNAVAKGTTTIFSPRMSDRMLDWYAQRIADAKTSTMFTGAFGVAPKILARLEKRTGAVRFVLLEKPPDADLTTAEAEQRDELLISYGAVLGYESKSTPQGGRTFVPIARFPLDEWFLREELARPSRQGFIFFLHTKFLLVDALADDPLVCTGSANFSPGSLTENDENMLLIRGDTRVADIYLTEFDRIFRHFYFRDVADDLAMKGRESTAIFLDESGTWVKPHFESGTFDYHRRLMFFADTKKGWAQQATSDADPFAGEKPAPLPAEPDKPPARVVPLKPVVIEPPKPPPAPPQPIVAKPLAPPVAKPLARPLVPPPIPMKPAEKPGVKGPTPKVPPKPPAPTPSAKPPATVRPAGPVASKPVAGSTATKVAEQPPAAKPTTPPVKPTVSSGPAKPAEKLVPSTGAKPAAPPSAGPPAPVKPAPKAAPIAVKPPTTQAAPKPVAVQATPGKSLAKPADKTTAAKQAGSKATAAKAAPKPVAGKPPAAVAKPPAKSSAPHRSPATPAAKGAAKPSAAKKPVDKAKSAKKPAVKAKPAQPSKSTTKRVTKTISAKPSTREAAAKQARSASKAKPKATKAKPIRKPATKTTGKAAAKPSRPSGKASAKPVKRPLKSAGASKKVASAQRKPLKKKPRSSR